MGQSLIVVSNRLPITLGEDGEIKKSSGGLVAALEGMTDRSRPVTWLGWPGKDVAEVERARLAGRLEAEFGCSPVFVSDELSKGHYEGFANSSVWPLFHNLPSYFQYRAGWWDAYRRVNELFAEAILARAKDGDLVWVHDYQLMLLPELLKRANGSLRVGFFLHTPFPGYDLFRCLPHREEVLAGVLGADLVGFHTFGYLRDFRSNVGRLLGHEAEMMTVRHDERETTLDVYPIGINAPKFDEMMDSAAFRERVAATAAAHAGKRLVVSVERLDYTKGIPRRLDAIEILLSRLDAGAREALKFVFVSVPTRGGVDEYRDLREDVEGRVGRINGEYATLNNSPVHFIHGSVGFDELCALYALAEVALVTPLIDGMNLVAKEYVACHREGKGPSDAAGGTASGVLLLSEFAGAAQELPTAILVNPYDAPGVADALERALAMPDGERRGRMRAMRERVFAYDAAAWANDFVQDLAARPAKGCAVETSVDEARGRLAGAIAAGRRVGLFLDYDGTLREIVNDPAAAGPTPEVRRLFDRLRGLANVDVTIVSGRTAAELDSFLGRYETFGLVAEHGAALRPPGSREWRQLDGQIDFGWKAQVEPVLRLYQQHTPGSHVEEKRTGMVWHYRRADPEFGRWKASQLVDELSIVTANQPIVVRHGRRIVEVASAQISKGAAVAGLVADGAYDLVLVAGDDATDESMFRMEGGGAGVEVISVRVGAGETHAQYRVPTPGAFRGFVEGAVGGG